MLCCAPLLLFVFELASGQLTLPEMLNKAPCNPKGLAYLGIFLQVYGLHIDVKKLRASLQRSLEFPPHWQHYHGQQPVHH